MQLDEQRELSSQASAQLPPLHETLHVAPSAHDVLQLPPLQLTFAVAPSFVAIEQLPPSQLMLHTAPSLQENAQLPSGHAQLHCCPSVQTWPPLAGGGPGGGPSIPGGGPLEYCGGGGLGDATHATIAIKEDRKQSLDMGASGSSAGTVARAMSC